MTMIMMIMMMMIMMMMIMMMMMMMMIYPIHCNNLAYPMRVPIACFSRKNFFTTWKEEAEKDRRGRGERRMRRRSRCAVYSFKSLRNSAVQDPRRRCRALERQRQGVDAEDAGEGKAEDAAEDTAEDTAEDAR